MPDHLSKTAHLSWLNHPQPSYVLYSTASYAACFCMPETWTILLRMFSAKYPLDTLTNISKQWKELIWWLNLPHIWMPPRSFSIIPSCYQHNSCRVYPTRPSLVHDQTHCTHLVMLAWPYAAHTFLEAGYKAKTRHAGAHTSAVRAIPAASSSLAFPLCCSSHLSKEQAAAWVSFVLRAGISQQSSPLCSGETPSSAWPWSLCHLLVAEGLQGQVVVGSRLLERGTGSTWTVLTRCMGWLPIILRGLLLNWLSQWESEKTAHIKATEIHITGWRQIFI